MTRRPRMLRTLRCAMVGVLPLVFPSAASAQKPPAAPPNRAPQVTATPAVVDEDASFEGRIAAQDPDGDALSFRVARKPRHGALTLDEKTGAFRYAPQKNFHGDDAFEVEVRDAKLGSKAEVKLSIRPVNDAPTLEGAAVSAREDTVTNGRVRGSDVDGDPLTYAVAKRPTAGEVSLEAASGAFRYTPRSDFHGDDSFTVEVSDGKAKASAAMKITVSPVNDAPVAKPMAIAGPEDGTASGTVVASDVDGDPLRYRVLRKPRSGDVALKDSGAGTFSYTPRKNFSGEDAFALEVSDGKARVAAEVKVTVAPVNDAPTVSKISLRGAEDKAITAEVVATDVDGDKLSFGVATKPKHGLAEMRGSTGALKYTPLSDYFGADTFTVEVSDGKASASATVEIEVTPINDPPTLAALTLATNEDQAVSGAMTATDPEGDKLRFTLGARAKNGEVAVDETSGKVSYTPRRDWHGEDTFKVAVSDGKLSATSQISVKVAPVNDPPVAREIVLRGLEDQVAKAEVVATDVDKDALSFRLAAKAANGDVKLDEKTGALSYTPRKDSFGADAFSVEISDGKARVTVSAKVEVAPVNDPPALAALTLATDEDQAVSGALSATDAEGDKLRFTLGARARNGEVAVDESSGAVSYTPRPDWHGEDTFGVAVSDGKLSATTQVSVKVAPANDPPVAREIVLRGLEDQVVKAQVLATDVDKDALSFRLAAKAANGDVKLDERTGAISYTPRKDSFGADTFSLEISDGKARVTANAKVEVAPVNDPPTLAALTLATDEDQAVSDALSATDPEGDALRFRLRGGARNGEVTVEEGSGKLSYTPRADWHGDDTFTVEVSDGKLSATTQVSVKVSPRNDPPVVRGGAHRGREDEPVELRVPATDVDGDALSFRATAQPRNGSVEVLDAKAGRFRYTPSANFHGKDAFTVAADDGKVASTAEITVEVSAVNDPPLARATSASVSEDGVVELTVSASDVDENPFSFRVARAAKSGEASLLDAAKGRFSYKPRRNYSGPDSFLVEVSDGTARSTAEVSISVTPVNDAPVVEPLALKTAEDTAAQGRVSARDVDGDALSYRVASRPKIGDVQVDEKTGALSYTPRRNLNGSDSFVIEVSDGKESARVDVGVEVYRVPEPPVVRDEVLDTREDEPITVTLPAEDPDGDKLTFRLLSKPKRGSATLEDAATGELLFTPDANANGEDQLSFEVSDGKHTVKAIARIRIAPVNDAPTVEAVEVNGEEDRPVSGVFTGQDIDGDTLSYRIHRAPKKGKVSITKEAPSRFTFTPSANQEGVETFEVVAFDGTAASEPATVTVRIKGRNDPPVVATGQSFTTEEDTPHKGVLKASDRDANVLTYRITRQPARGVVRIDEATSGRFEYTPKKDLFGTDSFSFSVTDTEGESATGLVRVKVTAVDDPPVAIREYTDAPKYGQVTRKLKGFDPEGKAITFRIVKQPPFGRVKLRDADDGEYVFVTNGDGSGNVQFEFVVNDGGQDSSPAAVIVNVR